MTEETKNNMLPMPEPVALALAIAGLYGEALRAQARGDTAGASQCLQAFDRLAALNLERGAPEITQGLCATMRDGRERRTGQVGHCKGCKHFVERIDDTYIDPPKGFGMCSISETRANNPGSQSRLFFAQDAEEYNAWLVVDPDFSCVRFEAKQ